MVFEFKGSEIVSIFVGSCIAGACIWVCGYCTAKYEDYIEQHKKKDISKD